MDQNRTASRRLWPHALGAAVVATAAALVLGPATFAQGRCMRGYGTQGCPLDEKTATQPIAPLFAPTGWSTIALEHITFSVADYQSEAAFYAALMGWKLRADDGAQAVMDIGDWGTAVFKQRPDAAPPVGGAPGGGGGGRGRGAGSASVESFGFVIAPWNARTVEAELKKRGLAPVAQNDGKGFESFVIKDPDGFTLQISNGNGLSKARKAGPPTAKLERPATIDPTGWKTIWLDHLSFSVTNYKESASFYMNLLGWKPTYDEGSQHELMIGEVGDVIIRGGNPFDSRYVKDGPRNARIDHISFGIEPWDTDGVKAELEKRGLRARVDTSTGDDIHVAAFRSYHTTTPNGYDLQISWVTHANRLALPNAVKPKGGR